MPCRLDRPMGFGSRRADLGNEPTRNLERNSRLESRRRGFSTSTLHCQLENLSWSGVYEC
jgi:hypothetical protein